MKTMKKGISVLTFILAIVAIICTYDSKTYATSAEISEVTNTVSHEYDDYFRNVKLEKSTTKATGLKFQLNLSNIRLHSKKYKVSWESSNAKIASVSASGQVYTKSAGKVVIKAYVVCDNKAVYTYTSEVIVTNPHFAQEEIGMPIGSTIKLTLYGTNASKYALHIGNRKIIDRTGRDKKSVKAYQYGKAAVWTWVDGKKVSCNVYVSNPSLTCKDYFITMGTSEKIRIRNWSGKTASTYYSSNNSVATVGRDGRIYGKRAGSCVVTAIVDNKKLSCYVAVGNKTVTNTLKSAYGCLGCRYSQSRRMSKGYYDCSSFTWRNYSKYGVNFGNKKYAPTASYEAINMVQNHKQISYRYVNPNRLLPGDVIFVKSHSRTNRYRNIGHVVIYMGNGRIIHATPPRVTIGTYSGYSKRIAVITRPTR